MVARQRGPAKRLGFGIVGEAQVERRTLGDLTPRRLNDVIAPRLSPALLDGIGEARRVERRNAAAEQRPEHAMDQAAGAAIDQRQRGRDQCVIGGAEPHLLRKREAQHGPRLAVVGQALAGGAVDQAVEVRQAAHGLAGDRHRQRLVRRGKPAHLLRRRVDRQPAPEHGIEDLQRGAARANPLSAWHRGSQCSS